ncbi:TonB family protein [Duganella sp. BJB488]|uniref:TonB family protein n=1 Tax=unclassified Duganella TaxID=2636909 RepID=UPI000E341884|nr:MULTISPECIES: TonB family protein [unclassified Duganella]RFP23047.1 TonB family protein [Duganella sp. BJB489]RFP24876.1 TonB family protein [Duganella sp. BJB488]RFP34047.1 TonB family protein [Duganella sp. BJB480]
MTKFHSHYESLNVTRDAPPEVIRAAYRSLSQKHHPDKNSGNAEAARMMARLNAAYSVLSDADQRELYDLQMLSEQRFRSPEFAFQASVDDDSAPVPYESSAPEQSGRGTRTAPETPAGKARGETGTLRQQLGHFVRGRAARVAALVFALAMVVMLPLLWLLWKDNQSMLRIEQAAMYAPGTAAGVPEETTKAKPADDNLAQKPAGKDGVAAEVSKPAAVQKAPAAPSAPIKASEFERLTAMLKNMGLGLHKLDLPAAPSSAKQAPPPAKPAETAKAGAAPAPVAQAAKPAPAAENIRPKDEAERAAAPEPVRSETRAVAEASRASAPVAASAASASQAARPAVVMDTRACATPEYPPNAYRRGENGSVQLALLVGTDGRVIESKLQKSSGSSELDKAARKSLSQCKFKTTNGEAITEATWTSLTYVWTLD